LIQKLRGRKSYYLQTKFIVLLVHVNELYVALMSKSSLGCCIDNNW